MHNVTTSRHIRTSSELMIMVPIKNDFVPITDLVMTYASRISVVLQALAEIRQLKVERGFGDPIGPIERLQTIYRVQWTVIEPFDDVTTSQSAVMRQMHGPQVVLTSHFDSSWEAYFQALVTTGGPLLDLIFSHCQDYEGFSCQNGFEAFSSFIRRHQRRCDFLYATAPEVTIDDVRYFTRYASGVQGGVPGRVPSMVKEARAINRWQVAAVGHDDRTRAALRTIHALHDIRERLFLDTGGLPGGAGGRGDRTDRKLYDDAVKSTLELEPELFRLSTVLQKARPALPPSELEKAREWVAMIVPKATPEPLAPLCEASAHEPTSPLDQVEIDKLLGDTQGNILNSNVLNHDAMPESAKLVLVRCHDAAGLRELLRWAESNVPSERAIRAGTALVHVNLGITRYGIELLKLPKGVMERFPREFREGMEERAGLLGDVAHNHPHHWKLPLLPNGQERAHLSTVHVALVMQGPTQAVQDLYATLDELAQSHGEIIHTLELRHSGQPELSQPIPPRPLMSATQREHAYSPLDVQALGELLLGYKGRAGFVDDQAQFLDLFKNGCFMAMRKMAIRKASANKTALDAYVEDVARQIKGDEPLSPADWAELLQDVNALVMGRKPNGQMLGALQPPASAAANAFDFSKDPEGKICPLGSHIRRSNPREIDTPRIARRGIPYQQAAAGPEPDEEGLLFMAYCASLSAQYEIVQRWVNGGNASGLLSRHNDPLCGAPVEQRVPRVVSLEGTIASKIPGAPRQIALQLPVDPFITLRWGMYLFMPSLTALETLQRDFPAEKDELRKLSIARGEARMRELDAMSPALRTHELRRLLEEVPEADSPQARHAKDVAAAITDAGGARRFVGEHGVDVIIITKADLAGQVLGNSAAFSVRKYRERMKRALRDHYLGYDLCSKDDATQLTYEKLATAANQEIEKLGEIALADKDAYKIAKRLLSQPDTLQLDPDGTGQDGTLRNTISVRDLAEAVIGELCHKWLDMPGKGRATASNKDDVENTQGWMGAVQRLLIASRYCFQAFPVPFLEQQAANNQFDILADYDQADPPRSTIGSVIGAQHSTLANTEIKRLTTTVLLGAVGFAPPAVGAITRILDHWIETESLWQIQRSLHAQACDLKQLIRDALSKVPAPPTLYRTAVAATKLGRVDVPQNALVIVNLAAVYEDALPNDNRAEAWFFGGVHGGAAGGAPQHGCPGRGAGMLAIEQIIRAVLECKNLRRERRLLLSYDR